MKKWIALLLSAVMLLAFSACQVTTGESSASSTAPDSKSSSNGSAAESGTSTESTAAGDSLSGVTLEIAVNYTGPQAEEFRKLVDKFKAETGCEVNISEYGTDYESTMKTRMASNELPDIFNTHGWSILRYKEYLTDLRDEAWVADYNESALGVIQDDDGAIYVLMTSQLVNGTLVDLDVCEAAGVDPYSIHTWEDFTAACEKVKAAGYVPIGSISNPGLFANIAGTWVSYKGELNESSDAMLDGSWDWQSFKPLLEQYVKWIDAGYFYDDILTMKDTDLSERFATGKAAFNVGNDPSFLVNCLELNPEANYAFLPTFASKEGGSEFVGIGEGNTFGIAKNTKNLDASKAFLNFMAKAENAVALNTSTGSISCLTSAMELDKSYGLQVFADMQERDTDNAVLYENLWDRKYMPSGMWPIFGNAVNMLFDDHSEAGVDATLSYLQENYTDLYEIAQEG